VFGPTKAQSYFSGANQNFIGKGFLLQNQNKHGFYEGGRLVFIVWGARATVGVGPANEWGGLRISTSWVENQPGGQEGVVAEDTKLKQTV